MAIAYAGQVTNGAYTPPNTKFTLTDTRGNTWYPGPIVTNPTGMVSAEQMFYAQNFNGGAASTVTATLANGSGNYSVGLVLYEFSGVATSNAVDISSSFVPTVASSTGNAGTINTRTSCDLVVAGILDGNVNGQYVYSGGGGFTEAIQDEWFPAGFLDNSATGSAYGATVSATLTGMLPADSDWVGTQMAFRASTTSALPQPTQLAFATSGQTVSHNTCSAVVTVSTLDSGSNLTTTSAGAVVTLSGAGLTYYADSTCTYPITTATIGAGSSGVSFYYKAAAVGSPVISAAATGYTTITQTETSN